MSDQPIPTSSNEVIVAVISVQLKEINKKLDDLRADHDALVRLQVQVKQNQKDIGRLAEKGRERDKARRRESFFEMLAAAAIGVGSSWMRPTQ